MKRILFIIIIVASSIGVAAQNVVDLGLSVLWSDCNLGNEGKYWTGSGVDSYLNSSTNIKLRSEGWRLPSKGELEELINECTWQCIMQDDVWGYQVTGKNGNSIFLPMLGIFDLGAGRLMFYGKAAFYWSSTIHHVDKTYGTTAYVLQIANFNKKGDTFFIDTSNISANPSCVRLVKEKSN